MRNKKQNHVNTTILKRKLKKVEAKLKLFEKKVMYIQQKLMKNIMFFMEMNLKVKSKVQVKIRQKMDNGLEGLLKKALNMLLIHYLVLVLLIDGKKY